MSYEFFNWFFPFLKSIYTSGVTIWSWLTYPILPGITPLSLLGITSILVLIVAVIIKSFLK